MEKVPADIMPQEVPGVASQVTFRTSMSQPSRINAIYYPNYRAAEGKTPATLNFNCITLVYYAFAKVNADGSVTLSDEYTDLKMTVDGASGCIKAMMNVKKRYPYLKVILSIGGGSGSQNFASAASSPATRDKFASTSRGLMDQFGFDGIDIDWETPENQQQGSDFLNLLVKLRTKLPQPQYYVTAALPAGEWAFQYIDVNKLQSYLDVINLMAYDFFGTWTSVSGHQSQLFSKNPDESSGDKAIHYLLSKGYPASKILLGIPAYGRPFRGTSGPGQKYKSVGDEIAFKNLPPSNIQEYVDKEAIAAYCVARDSGFITYDNPETVKFKADYVVKFGLAGLFYWEVTQDADTGPRSLVYTGFNALNP